MMRGIQQDARELSREVPFETYLGMVRRDQRLARGLERTRRAWGGIRRRGYFTSSL